MLSRFSTRLDIKHSSDLIKESPGLLSRHLPLPFQIIFSPDHKNHRLLMRVFSYIFDPGLQISEWFLVIDGIGQEDGCYSFIEGSDNRFEHLLSCLFMIQGTVSHICNLMDLSSPISIIFEKYSTPIVTLYCSENFPLM